MSSQMVMGQWSIDLHQDCRPLLAQISGQFESSFANLIGAMYELL